MKEGINSMHGINNLLPMIGCKPLSDQVYDEGCA